MPKIFAVLRYTTTSGRDKFVSPLAFKDHFASFHADVSIPSAHLTVSYREKSYLAGSVISASASEVAEKVGRGEPGTG